MIRARVIPCLLVRGQGLVKTTKFKEPRYLGDPRNAVRIFNEKEVDELALLDIGAAASEAAPRFDFIEEIVSEAFMPVAYGGGLRTLDQVKRVLELGVEKVVLCSRAVEEPAFVEQAATAAGSQSVVVSLDVRRGWLGGYACFSHGGTRATGRDPVSLAAEMERRGAGEILVNSIDRDGTMSGYDVALVQAVASRVNVPVIACGGAGTLEHVAAVVEAGASAAAAGSLFVYQGRHRAVLISYPSQHELKQVLG